MSRTIVTVCDTSPMADCECLPATLESGESVLACLADFRKPRPGVWRLAVTLAKEGDCPMSASIALIQDKTQIGEGMIPIASKVVDLTDTPASYELEVTEEEIEKVTRGRCHISELKVSIGASGESCPSSSSSSSSSSDSSSSSGDSDTSSSSGTIIVPCCPGVTIPTTLRATLTSSCTALNGTITLTYSSFYERWLGELSNGCLFSFLMCDYLGAWIFSISSPNGGVSTEPDPGASCSPFNMTFSNLFVDHRDYPCCATDSTVTAVVTS